MRKLLTYFFTLLLSLSVNAVTTIDFDVTKIDEDKFLGPHKEARLLALSDAEHPFNEENPPLILVHGIKSNPSDLMPLIEKLKNQSFQLYVLAYDDFKTRTAKNGTFLSQEISKLGKRTVTLVAHSMGGLISRKAIADFVENRTIAEYETIRLFTIDTPWHGFEGPSDESFQMMFVNRFLPEGLIDMRAKSKFFRDLNEIEFPENVSIDIVFAKEGNQAKDYTEIISEPDLLHNFEVALKLTQKIKAHSQRLEDLFPRFSGNHSSVLKDKNLLNYIEAKINERPESYELSY